MQDLSLAKNSISGTLPVDWGRPVAYQGLTKLSIYSNLLTGVYVPGAQNQPGNLPCFIRPARLEVHSVGLKS